MSAEYLAGAHLETEIIGGVSWWTALIAGWLGLPIIL